MGTTMVIATILGAIAALITILIGGNTLWNRFFKKPKLALYTDVRSGIKVGGKPNRKLECVIIYGIINKGRATAKYVQLALRVVPHGVDERYGLDGNGNHGLPRVHSVDGFTKFAADADRVINPNGKFLVTATRLYVLEASPTSLEDAVIEYEISAEGAKPVKGEKTITAAEMIERVLPRKP